MSRPLFSLLVAAFLVSQSPCAEAVPRSRSGKVIAAMRQQEIARLQNQIEGAKAALDQLRNTASQDGAEIAEARNRAISARQSIAEASAAHQDSHKKIDELEERLLDAQSDSSDFAQAVKALEEAQHALDAEMHRILKWPAPADGETETGRLKELASLSIEERAALKADRAYAARLAAVTAASASLIRIRRQLLQASPEWKQLNEEHLTSTRDISEAERKRGGAANDRLNADKSLRTKAEIAASLSQTIAELEIRLRALGVAPTSRPGTSSSSPGRSQ